MVGTVWLVAVGGLQAQHSPYTGLEERDIKALSAEQVAGYLAGDGMGFALPAELNHYPGPKHVLDLSAVARNDKRATRANRGDLSRNEGGSSEAGSRGR